MITLDAEHIERAELLLKNIPGGIDKAVVRAINRSVDRAQTATVKKVRDRYYIKAGDVRKTIKVKKANYSDQIAIIRSTGSPVALSKFKITPSKPPQKRTKKPVRARVVKGEGGELKRRAFVAKMKSGHIGVFERAGKSRYPINQFYGPSVPQMLGHKSVVTYVKERAKEQLVSRLDHEIERLLRGAGR